MALKEHTTTDGILVYDQRGMGDPLLLVHGIYPGASHAEFSRNIPALQRHFTVYAVDLIGFGQSDTPRRSHSAQMHQHLLRDFIRDVVGVPVHIAASGISAGIAARLGVYEDSILNRIVLLSPVHKEDFHEPPGLADHFSQFLLGTLAIGASNYRVAASHPGIYEFLREHYHSPQAITRDMIDQLFIEANEPNKMMPYISALSGYFDTDLTHWLPSVRRATQIIIGSDLIPVPQDKWMRKAPWSMGRQFDVVEAARDFPHQEQSAQTNQLMIEFLSHP